MLTCIQDAFKYQRLNFYPGNIFKELYTLTGLTECMLKICTYFQDTNLYAHAAHTYSHNIYIREYEDVYMKLKR